MCGSVYFLFLRFGKVESSTVCEKGAVFVLFCIQFSICWWPCHVQGVSFELDERLIAEDEEREALQDIINNTKLSEGYLTLARDIEVMEPKSPEDIYKVSYLEHHSADSSDCLSSTMHLFLLHADKCLTID